MSNHNHTDDQNHPLVSMEENDNRAELNLISELNNKYFTYSEGYAEVALNGLENFRHGLEEVFGKENVNKFERYLEIYKDDINDRSRAFAEESIKLFEDNRERESCYIWNISAIRENQFRDAALRYHQETTDSLNYYINLRALAQYRMGDTDSSEQNTPISANLRECFDMNQWDTLRILCFIGNCLYTDREDDDRVHFIIHPVKNDPATLTYGNEINSLEGDYDKELLNVVKGHRPPLAYASLMAIKAISWLTYKAAGKSGLNIILGDWKDKIIINSKTRLFEIFECAHKYMSISYIDTPPEELISLYYHLIILIELGYFENAERSESLNILTNSYKSIQSFKNYHKEKGINIFSNEMGGKESFACNAFYAMAIAKTTHELLTKIDAVGDTFKDLDNCLIDVYSFITNFCWVDKLVEEDRTIIPAGFAANEDYKNFVNLSHSELCFRIFGFIDYFNEVLPNSELISTIDWQNWLSTENRWEDFVETLKACRHNSGFCIHPSGMVDLYSTYSAYRLLQFIKRKDYDNRFPIPDELELHGKELFEQLENHRNTGGTGCPRGFDDPSIASPLELRRLNEQKEKERSNTWKKLVQDNVTGWIERGLENKFVLVNNKGMLLASSAKMAPLAIAAKAYHGKPDTYLICYVNESGFTEINI